VSLFVRQLELPCDFNRDVGSMSVILVAVGDRNIVLGESFGSLRCFSIVFVVVTFIFLIVREFFRQIENQ
jgi:hypothetical protein